MNSELSDVIHEDNYFKNSSCFLFHIDGKLRRFCLTLAEPRVHVDEVFRIRDRIPDYKIRVPLLEQKEGEYQGMDKTTLSTYDLRNRIFDNVILLMILVSSAMLPLDSPMNNPNSP